MKTEPLSAIPTYLEMILQIWLLKKYFSSCEIFASHHRVMTLTQCQMEARFLLWPLLYLQHWAKRLLRVFSNHHGNATQNHNDISPQTCQDGCHKNKNTSVGEDEQRLNACILCWKCNNGAVTMKNSKEVGQKVKNRTTILSSNPTPGYLSRKIRASIVSEKKNVWLL